MPSIFIEVTETERQAIAEGLRLLMEKGGFVCDEEQTSMTPNNLDDLILQVLNA